MEYRSLEPESLQRIHQCFSEAFSDYVVRVQLTFEAFQRTMVRNGVDLRYSIGLYDRDHLAGFILNGVGTWNDLPTVYDSGTGITRAYRGKKYAKNMFYALKQSLEGHFSRYLLEVIQTNTPAFLLYSGLGFRIERELLCFTINKADLPRTDTRLDLRFRKVPLTWGLFKSFWNSSPSWQNSMQAVERISPHLEKIGGYLDDECVGYGVFDPQNGEILQIAVRKDLRGRGIGSMLLQVISAETGGSALRIINVDKRDEETVQFFRKSRFKNDVNQYEMILDLNGR